MRSDVLDLMADEINARPVGKLASFLAFDGSGRAKLDGMGAGKRWDIDREQREFERDSKAELQRLKCRKFKLAHPEYFAAWMRAARARDVEAARAKDRKRYERDKARIQARGRTYAQRRTEDQAAKAAAAKRRWYERNRDLVLAKAKASREADVSASRARDRLAYSRRRE
jgi:hypothetical protein